MARDIQVSIGKVNTEENGLITKGMEIATKLTHLDMSVRQYVVWLSRRLVNEHKHK